MDYELARHVNLTPQIMDALRQTAIMIVILSPGYLASEWCNRERNAFLELIRESGSRIFLIERDLVEPRNCPSEFHDLLGFRFWIRDREGKPPRILGVPEPSKDEREYYSRVDDITFELAEELSNLKKAYEEPPGSGSEQKRLTVYLAQVTDDLEQDRISMKSYLSQYGIAVLPNTWYSQEPIRFKQSVESDLSKCTAFVQLLSSIAGKKPPDLPQGYLHLQFELARAARKSIFQWRNPYLDTTSIQDDEHRSLVDGETVRAEGIEDFKRAVRDFVLMKPTGAERKSLSAFVFVNMETADRPLAEKVCTVLDRHGIGYSLPIDSGDPAEIRADLKSNLLDSNGIIVIYGTSTAVWVRRQLMEGRKILSQRDRPLEAFAVFEGPPEQKCQIDLKLPNLQFLNLRKGVDDSVLEKELTVFISRLGKERA